MDLTSGLKIICPACQQVATSTRYGPGRPVESGPIQPPSITFEPCGHGMTGWAAARQQYRISDLLAAHRAGREDAAKAIEASDVIYAWQAVEVARGTQQPRTPEADVTP